MTQKPKSEDRESNEMESSFGKKLDEILERVQMFSSETYNPELALTNSEAHKAIIALIVSIVPDERNEKALLGAKDSYGYGYNQFRKEILGRIAK